MNTLDNGPRDGDYARYIDELVARAAVVVPSAPFDASTTTLPTMPTMPEERPRPLVPAVVVRRDATTTRRGDASAGPAPRASIGPVAPTSSGAGWTVATPSSPDGPPSLEALAGRLGRQVATLSPRTVAAVGAVLAGLVLALVGILATPFAIAPLVLGLGVASWGLGELKKRRASTLPTAGATRRG